VNWNCLVLGSNEGGGAYQKLIRITSRGKKFDRNTGGSSWSPSDQRFIGGTVGNLSGSEVLVPEQSDWSQSDKELDHVSLTYDGEEFCKGSEHGGFEEQGGIVCFLDADYDRFNEQLSMVLAADKLIGGGTSQVIIDFAAYNGNLNMIAYIQIMFTIEPTGVVVKTLDTNSMRLFDLDRIEENALGILGRIVPGILYSMLVIGFAIKLKNDWKSECFRKWVNYHTKRPQATWEFFVRDIYNPLELVSITVSIVSGIMFLYWIWQEGKKWMFEKEYNEFLNYLLNLSIVARQYNRISAINMLMIFVRPLKYARENPRMAQFYQTLWGCSNDTSWFVVILAITMFGFSLFAYVSFGPYYEKCSNLSSVFAFCFNFLLGHFELDPLTKADPIMSWIFFWPYLITCYLIYTNIFFAIIDRYFISEETPPINYKRKLKPFLHRICRCIEWDEEFQMDADPDATHKAHVKSRREKARLLSQTIQEIKRRGRDDTPSAASKKSKTIQEVCDQADFDKDARMASVKAWSQEEAKKFVAKFRKLLKEKNESRDAEQFIRNVVMKKVRAEKKTAEKAMNTMKRRKIYEIEVKEKLQRQDQETLSKYIVYLEESIQKQMAVKYALEQQVKELVKQSQNMQDGPDVENLDVPDDYGGYGDGNGHEAIENVLPALGNGEDLSPKDDASIAGSNSQREQLLPGDDGNGTALALSNAASPRDDDQVSNGNGNGNAPSAGGKDGRRSFGSTRRSVVQRGPAGEGRASARKEGSRKLANELHKQLGGD
jgi:hypothetical protein